MKKILIPLLISILFISGCKVTGQQQNVQGPSIKNVVDDAIRQQVAPALKDQKDSLKGDIQTSQNAIQTNMQSLLGVEVGKVADSVTGIKAQVDSLVTLNTKFETSFSNKIDKIETNLSNQIAINTQLQSKIDAQLRINTDLQAKINTQVRLNADLEAKVQAQAQVVAGIGNKVESTNTDLKAGRDVFNNQFTNEVLKAIQSSNYLTMGICISLCLMMVVLQYILNRQHSKTNTALMETAVRAIDPARGRDILKP